MGIQVVGSVALCGDVLEVVECLFLVVYLEDHQGTAMLWYRGSLLFSMLR